MVHMKVMKRHIHLLLPGQVIRRHDSMARLQCRLRLLTDSPHTHQIITGFIMLQREGIIDLDIQMAPGRRESCPAPQIVEAVLNDRVRLAYDVLDGYNFPPGATSLETYLAAVDFYFKRSYDPARHGALRYASRIYPLGLNYHVVTGHATFRRLASPTLAELARYTRHRLSGYYRMYGVEEFEDVPRHPTSPTVLFVARTWNPGGEQFEQGSPSSREACERSSINDLRAECIRLLRKEFGARFVGGFVSSDYARKHFPDCILDGSLTRKATYMTLVKQSHICIASMGLHGSNGWKLAEYVAASKAIVSERLRYEVPGNFSPERNYLPFDRPQQCVENVGELLAHERLAYEMKVNNYEYYHRFVRPDRLVLNTLVVALHGGTASSNGSA